MAAGRSRGQGGPERAARVCRRWVGAVGRQAAAQEGEAATASSGLSPPPVGLEGGVWQRGVVGFGLVWFGLQKSEMLSSPDLMRISADRMSPP